MSKAITEFLGTFFLVLIIGLAASGAGQFAPIAIGIGLAVLVYMGGHVSGAHYNPAVTIGLAAIGKVRPVEVPVYLAAQFVGGLLGAVASAIFTGSGMAVAPAKGATIVTAGSVEVLFTALLVLVICNVAACARTKGNQFYGFAIGGTVLAAALAALGTAPNQLKIHIKGALNCGCTREEIVEVFMAREGGRVSSGAARPIILMVRAAQSTSLQGSASSPFLM